MNALAICNQSQTMATASDPGPGPNPTSESETDSVSVSVRVGVFGEELQFTLALPAIKSNQVRMQRASSRFSL